MRLKENSNEFPEQGYRPASQTLLTGLKLRPRVSQAIQKRDEQNKNYYTSVGYRRLFNTYNKHFDHLTFWLGLLVLYKDSSVAP